MSNQPTHPSRLRDRRHPGLPNRVHADGSLHAVAARGTMMGNRGGRFHTPAGDGPQVVKNPKRPWSNKQWICCALTFKQRQRHVWGAGYTEVFFLDEATALSAGHRPCFECRRQDAKAFQAAMFAAHASTQRWEKPPVAKQIDDLLHTARLCKKHTSSNLSDLPVGAMVRHNGVVLAKCPTRILRWTFQGYQPLSEPAMTTGVDLLTPEPILAALGQGYTPSWHASALERA